MSRSNPQPSRRTVGFRPFSGTERRESETTEGESGPNLSSNWRSC